MDIKTKRRFYNLTQRELADLTGLSIGTILRAEKTGNITAKNLRLITQKLDEHGKSKSMDIVSNSNLNNLILCNS